MSEVHASSLRSSQSCTAELHCIIEEMQDGSGLAAWPEHMGPHTGLEQCLTILLAQLRTQARRLLRCEGRSADPK